MTAQIQPLRRTYVPAGNPPLAARSPRKSAGLTSTNFGWLCLFAYAASCSFYIFPSGLPQASDYALAFGALVFVIDSGWAHFLKANTFLKTTALLVGYTCIVAAIWYGIEGDTFTIKSPLFYAFNHLAALLLIGLSIKSPNRFYPRLALVLLIAAASSTAILLTGFDPAAARQSGGFNNPNQLGYFGLNLACLSFLTRSRLQRPSRALDIAAAAGILQVAMAMSLTSAAALLIALVGACSIYQFRVERLAAAGLAGLILAAAAAIFLPGLQAYVVKHWEVRINRVEEKTEDVGAARGWDRILENPEYAAFGAGEGASRRFGERIEIHSTPLAMLFCYGVPGLVLFLMMIRHATKKLVFAELLVVLPPILYTLTHQGLRTTMFWFVLAVAAIPLRTSKSLRRMQ